MEVSSIKQQLKNFLLKSFRIKEINDSDNIFSKGIVHSLFFIQLLIFIEKNFKIELHEGEFDIKKLTSINTIADMIASKVT